MPVWRRTPQPVCIMRPRLFTQRSSSPNPASAQSGSPLSDRSNEAIDPSVMSLWQKLEDQQRTQNWAFDSKKVAVNTTGIPCSKENNVTAPLGRAARTRIHANTIGQIAGANGSTGHYVAGQSPEPGSLDAILAQGIESGLGIFQFVSSNAHKNKSESSKKTILAMLKERIDHEKNIKNSKGLVIAEKYKVLGFKNRGISTTPYSQYDLKVEVIGPEPRSEITIPITQAGYPFRGAELQAEDIAHAHRALNAHKPSYLPTTPTAQSKTEQLQPLILSHAGIGRNATLITYDRIFNLINHATPAMRITTADALDNKLLELITEGRKARGPQFIHSRKQLAALRAALLGEIKDREHKNPDNRKNPVSFRDAHIRHNWRKRLSGVIPFKQLFISTKEKIGG
jgi:hypothetical protein